MSERMQKTLAALLTLAVVVAGLTVAWLVLERREAREPVEGNTAEAVGAVVASEELKGEVLEVAEDAAAKVFSYSHETITEDKTAAREMLTGEMLEQYDDTMAGVVGTSRANETVVSATVVGTALISVRSHDAKVLVFVNQRTTGTELDRPRLDLDRVVVSLERASGEWKVSELDAL